MTEKQIEKLESVMKPFFIYQKPVLKSLIKNLGKCISQELFLKNLFRISNNSDPFKYYGYKPTTLFKDQTLYQIFKLLPMKIETKHRASKINMNQTAEVGFIHNSLKNYFLLKAIKKEFATTKTSYILTAKALTNNFELIKAIEDDGLLQDYFTEIADTHHLQSEEILKNNILLLWMVGCAAGLLGKEDKKHLFLKRALYLSEKYLGEDHLLTATILSHLSEYFVDYRIKKIST